MNFLNNFKKWLSKNKFIKKIKKGINKIGKEKVKNILFMILPFILIDLFIFMIGRNINYVNYKIWAPFLFSTCWILLFVGISLSLKKSIGRWI